MMLRNGSTSATNPGCSGTVEPNSSMIAGPSTVAPADRSGRQRTGVSTYPSPASKQTARVLDWLVAACGVELTSVDARDVRLVAEALRPGSTSLVYVETPSNPLLHVVDVS